jgi:hypothetical protein
VLAPPTQARPAKPRTLEAGPTLHLLRSYASVVALRPLLAGNREFLASLLAACGVLDDALGAATPAPRVRELVARLRIDNATHVAAEIVRTLDASALDGRPEPLYVHGLAPLAGDYDRVTIVFGPGIGLGDEVTFLSLVSALAERWPTVVYTLYPGLWRLLVPEVRERHYRRRPLRPFADLQAREGEGRQLVVLADFELFDLADKVVPRRRGRDVLEISLGRSQVRLAPGTSPWTWWEVFDSDDGNNYETVRAAAERLLPATAPTETWSPLRPLRTADSNRRVRRLLLNPLSSKPLPFGANGWTGIMRQIASRLPQGTTLDVVVYPGLDAATEAYAAELCARLARVRTPIAVRVLRAPDGGPLTPTNAMQALGRGLARVDACVTVDTFTAHLAPLFGVPTAVLAYHTNYAFWVPAPWALYALLDEAEETLPPLVARLLLRGRLPGPGLAAGELAAATQAVSAEPLGRAAVEAIVQPLARCLAHLDPDFPYADEGGRWLALWSRVGSALRREPLPPAQLGAFVREWRRSPFFRLVTTSREEGWGS